MNRFADLRKRTGRSQDAIATELGVDRSTVAKWETGVAFPRGDKLPAVARAYGCEIKDFFDVPAQDDGEAQDGNDTDGNGVK